MRAVSETEAIPPPRENVWLSLLFNLALPTVILMQLSPEDRLGPQWALVLGLAFPLGYGVYDYVKRREINLFSILGLVAVLAKGIFGLLEANAVWIACSEAALPLLFGIVILWSARWELPLIERFLLSPQLFDIHRINESLAERDQAGQLRPLMVRTSQLYAITMLVSAALNFFLARAILKAEPGTEAFVAELGKLTGLQFPVIALPIMVMTVGIFWWVIRRLNQMTGLELDDMLAAHAAPKASAEEGEKG